MAGGGHCGVGQVRRGRCDKGGGGLLAVGGVVQRRGLQGEAGWLAIAGALQQADVLYREGGVRDGRREVVAGVLRQLQGRRLLGGRVG